MNSLFNNSETMNSHYNTVVSVAFSPSGDHFIAGNVHGDLVLVNLQNVLTSVENGVDDPGKFTKKCFSSSADQKVQIYSMTSSDQFLIIGFAGEIVGWRWQDLVNAESGQMPSSAWSIRVPREKYGTNLSEVNSLKLCPPSNMGSDVLYAACGDNVHSFSLEDGAHLRTYSGHKNYVHNIDVKDNIMVSASEDGSVRMNDCRTSALAGIIEPYKHKEVKRPDLGNWVGDVSLNEDWLVCGGGARLSLWSMRTTDCPMTVFENSADAGIHVCRLHQNDILAGGSAPYLSVLSLNDELRSGLQCSHRIVYSLAVHTEENSPKILASVGNSNDIDVTTNFRYREFTVPFY